jgi:hypothetical protein
MEATMIEFFQAGGFAMWPVLFFGAAALVTAALFARQPDERRMALIRALNLTTLFAMFTGFAANIATVMYFVPRIAAERGEPVANIVMIGIGESLSPVIMGGSFLTLVWLVAAVGMRRLADRLSAYQPAA